MKGINVDEKDFELEKKVVIEERRLRTEDDPGSFMQEAAMAATFEAHPYQWPVIGWLHDIESISLEDYQNYYHRYYLPNNCTLVVVGDIEPQGGLDGDRSHFRGFAGRAGAPQGDRQGAAAIWANAGWRCIGRRSSPISCMNYHVPNWQRPGRLSPGVAHPHPLPGP